MGLTACSDRELEKMERQKQGWSTRRDGWSDVKTSNAPAWGGGVAYTSGWRERSPPSRSRVLNKTASTSSLARALSPSLSKAAFSLANRRSLSPQLVRRLDEMAVTMEGDLRPGSPVYFSLEGDPETRFGWIMSTDDEGRF